MSSSKEQTQSDVVSVVVTYNGMPWIDRCLGSLHSSSLPTRIVVVDNGSTDGTQQRIKEAFPTVHFIQTGKNLGFGQANNLGLRIALDNSNVHAFLLNQDAWVGPDTIEKLVQAAIKYPQFGVLSPMHLNGKGDALDFRFSKYISPDRCPGLYSDLVLDRPKVVPYRVQFVNAAAWLITDKCLRTVGGFNPSFFHYGEDDNYVARVHYHGMQVGILAGTSIYHDRADREENIYATDTEIRDSRKLVMEYADPNLEKDPELELRSLKWALAKHLALGRKKSFLDARRRLRLMRECSLSEVIANRNLSRRAGPSFLG